MTFYPIPRGVVPQPPGLSSRPRFFYFFSTYLFALPLARQGARSGAKDGPKCPKGAQKEPKSSLSRATCVTFRCQIGESGPLLKHQQGLCFHHIMRVRAPLFLLLNSPRERTAHRECSFSPFWLHFRRPSGTQGRPKGAQRAQKESQGLPWDAKKPSKIDLGPHLGTQGSPGGSGGTPGTENDTKID